MNSKDTTTMDSLTLKQMEMEIRRAELYLSSNDTSVRAKVCDELDCTAVDAEDKLNAQELVGANQCNSSMDQENTQEDTQEYTAPFMENEDCDYSEMDDMQEMLKEYKNNMQKWKRENRSKCALTLHTKSSSLKQQSKIVPASKIPKPRKAQKVEKEEYAYKPKITPYPGTERLTSGAARIDELAVSREKIYAQREQAKMKQQTEQLKSYTFHPKIGKDVKKIIPDRVHGSVREQHTGEICAADRLHREGSRRLEWRNEKRRALEEYEMKQYSFRPQINPATANILDMQRYKPIQDRIPEMQLEKMQHRRQLQEDIEYQEREDLSFVPKINSKSQRLAHAKLQKEYEQENVPNNIVTQRLARESQKAFDRKRQAQAKHDSENAKRHEFKPKLSSKSRKLVKKKPEFQLDFLERQQVMQEKKYQTRAELLTREQITGKNGKPCTFSPCIGNTNRILQYTRADRLEETSAQRLDRLSNLEQANIVEAREKISGDYYAQFTFKPKINPISKEIGRRSSVQELTQNENVAQARLAVAQEVHAKQMAECTFHPKTNHAKANDRSKRNVTNPKVFMEKIEKKRQQQEEKRQEERRRREYEELKHCTFSPQTNHTLNSGNVTKTVKKPVVVRGLGRFLELKALKKHQDHEKQQRENEVFYRHNSSNNRQYKGSVTVVKPFKLSYQKETGKNKQELLKHQLKQVELEECTFQPQTMESTNRKMIQHMLLDEKINDKTSLESFKLKQDLPWEENPAYSPPKADHYYQYAANNQVYH